MTRIALAFILFSLSSFCDQLWARSVGQLSLSQEAFVSPDYYTTEQKSFSFLELSFKTRPDAAAAKNSDEKLSGLYTEINGQVSPGIPVMSYLNIRQLYWQESSFRAGRYLHRWSDLDSRWNLGVFQPRLSWNELSPEQQGLTGLFLTLAPDENEPLWSLELFASPVYVPDQGPSFEVRDGKFVEVSPYFRVQPSQAVIMGVTDDIRYNVFKPELNEVVFRQSFAAQFSVGKYNQGLFFQASFANKPASQLALGVKGHSSVNSSVEVSVLPKVWTHRVSAADLRYSYKGWFASLGVFNETPQEPQFPEEWSYTAFASSRGWSPSIGYNQSRLQAELSFLEITEGQNTAKGQAAQLMPSSDRFPFNRAYQLKAKALIWSKGVQRFIVGTEYKAGADNEFNVWTSVAQYRFRSQWAWWGQTQMLNVNKDSAYSAFENNDSVRMGVSYVF